MIKGPITSRHLAFRGFLLATASAACGPLFARDMAAPMTAPPAAPAAASLATPTTAPSQTHSDPGAPVSAGAVVSPAASESPAANEIVVSGARATQRTSLQTKRTSSVIMDGIVNDSIGALPDNSVADTLERIVGVTTDRFKGNSNEISIRGLGPTLSFSTLNGREISTAGGDRSVAFQQFPSELVNGVLVYKSQQADFVEGGIAGVIDLRTIKPLDYGKRRIVMEVRGNENPQDADNRGRNGLGYRANISYTDQYQTGIGEIGIGIGYQHLDTTAPEDYYITNSAFQLCNTSANAPATSTANCTNATKAPSGSTLTDPYYATSSRTWSTYTTRERRDAALGTIEWKPASNLDIAIDGQYSKRRSTENRYSLSLVDGLRGLQPIEIGGDGNDASTGALEQVAGNSNIESQDQRRQRNETYVGGGANFTWKVGRLTLSGDGSYTGSHRTEFQQQTRLRSNRRVGYVLDATGDAVPSVTFTDFDISDPANYSLAGYGRYREVTNLRDQIWAGRLDALYELGDGFFQSIKLGTRYSDHTHVNNVNRNNDLDITDPALLAQASQQCAQSFPASGVMHGSGSNITNWATFDNDCLFNLFRPGGATVPPKSQHNTGDINVRERIWAGYALANFKSELGEVPFSGNAGIRYVSTTVNSLGYNTPLTVVIDNSGQFTVNPVAGAPYTITKSKADYHYWLPSSNVGFDLSDKLKLRFAFYRAISRADMGSFGTGVSLGATSGTATSVQQVVDNAATGNVALKPVRSWNLDASIELYATKDTFLSVAPFYKWLKGEVINGTVSRPTTLTVNGTQYTANPLAPQNSTGTNHLYGIEISGGHAFTELPSPFDGFGVTGGFEYAHSDFKFPDTSTIGVLVDPANIEGLSRINYNAQLYWEKGPLSVRTFYHYRTSYFKPNSGSNRSVRGSGFLDFAVQYNLTKNIQLKVQGQNVTSTRDIFYKGGPDDTDAVTEVSSTGPTYYFGVRVVF